MKVRAFDYFRRKRPRGYWEALHCETPGLPGSDKMLDILLSGRPANAGEDWSEEDIEFLIEMGRGKRWSVSKMAEELERTEREVLKMRKTLGIARK